VGMTPDWVGIVTQYGGKVVLIIMLGVLVLSLRKSVGQVVAEAFQPGSARGAAEAAGEEEVPEHFDGIPEMNDTVIHDIKEYASENPERVAEVIQSWIHDVDMGPLKAKAAVGD
jgi:flagellar biosynthesis/type III secretory pathway M-ring protein FliF/YscJ